MLSAAVEAARRADWPACLSALLAAWREAKDPAIAELIESVAPRAAGPPVGGSGSVKSSMAKRIAAATDADVDPILEVALREMRVTPHSHGYIVKLAAARPPDPRIAKALAEVIENPPFVELKRNAEGALQPDVVRALDAIDDPRYRELIVARWRVLEARRGYIRKRRPALDVLKAIAAEVQARPPIEPAELGDAPATILAELARATPEQRARGQDTSELLAAIYANPGDASLRLVYADVLQDAGDPRGEFIALQCGRAEDAPPSKRERELLRLHERTWLGAIEPIIRKQGLVYRRGFVACCREGLKYTKHYPLFEEPEWSTLEDLEVNVWNEVAVSFFLNPRWKALRRVFGLYRDTLSEIARRDVALPWTTLGVRHPEPGVWTSIADVMPALQELDLAGTSDRAALEQLTALGSTPLARRLRRIRLSTIRRTDLPTVLREAPCPEVEIVSEYTFPGVPEGCAVRIAGKHLTLVHHEAKVQTALAVRVLGALPPGTFETVALAAPAKARLADDDARTALVRELERHGLALALP